tara:strand:+ start:2346 stop:2732 length:387 start_codon:yes stop_codon:yes gene_type:complete
MIEIPVSYGELVDKLTILEIKLEMISEKSKINQVTNEYRYLSSIFDKIKSEQKTVLPYYEELLAINKKLWNIEDSIRRLEKQKKFNSEFIELARKVYYTNDERFEIKSKINALFNSNIKEQKSYENYK